MISHQYIENKEVSDRIQELMVLIKYNEQLIDHLEARFQDDKVLKLEGFDIITYKEDLSQFVIDRATERHAILLEEVADLLFVPKMNTSGAI